MWYSSSISFCTFVIAASSTSQVVSFGFTGRKCNTYTVKSAVQKSKNEGLHMSIPNSFDTATSGFASIARLPFGTTTILPATDKQKEIIRIKLLFDIEQSKECRQVRERITELDLVVETIVPSAANSLALNDKSYQYYIDGVAAGEPTMIVAKGEEDITLKGLDDIMTFLDSEFGPRGPIIDDVDEIKTNVVEFLIEIGSVLPGILRGSRGEAVARCALPASGTRPVKPLVLYSYEGNQFCRLVREVLTELDLPYELRSAGKGSPRRSELASITGGSTQCPYLIDSNTGIKMAESKDIIEYLYKNYALYTPPSEILGKTSEVISPFLRPIFKVLTPLQAGSNREDKSKYERDIASAKAEVEDEISSNKIVIYTYSLSPFCTEAIGVLDGLNLEYKEISLGYEWLPFLINEGGSEKRMALYEITGQSSLPHIFLNGESIGGLYEGLLPALDDGSFLQRYNRK